jgi:nicotinate phosphoribosyltransferase
MLRGALERGTAKRRSLFEVFARRLPEGRRYGVVAGTGRLLDALERFRFGPGELAWLAEAGIADAELAETLAGWRFQGNIWGYPEGEVFFPGSPLLVVEADFAEAVLLETLVLSILNHDCAIAAAASRMVCAAGERPCIEMGSRRTHEQAAVAAARAAYIAGFASTSNLEAGRRHEIPTGGTSAHAFTLLHDSERDAFAAQVAALGPGTTLLVDTYDVETAVRTAVEVAGTGLGAVRLDSGDLLAQAHWVRALLDDLGATSTRIVVTSDLDEFAIAALAAAPVDGYGAGTALVTGSGAPTASLVYKLVARAASSDPDAPLQPVAKTSVGKPSRGGRKVALRRFDPAGTAVAEVVATADDGAREGAAPDGTASGRTSLGAARRTSRPVRGRTSAADGSERPLLVPLVVDGTVVGGDTLSDARERHAASVAELPPSARRLSRGEPALPTLDTEVSR